MLPLSLHQRLSLHARHALKEARDIARYTKSETIEPRHLMLALALEEGSIGSILLDHLGCKKDALGKLCLKKTSQRTKIPKRTPLAELLPLFHTTQNIIKRAFYLASEHHYPYVGTEHLMSALLESTDPFLTLILQKFDIGEEKIKHLIESHLHFDQFPHMARMFEMPELDTLPDNASRSTTPYLDQYTVDLANVPLAATGAFVGRQAELERLMHILGRKEKRNALLVGDPGVGKTALVTALAHKITRGEAGSLLHGKHIHTLDLALLVAGTSFRGEFETRLKELLKEVKQKGTIILFIDEIHTLVGTGNTQGGLDAANILKPSLARGEIQCIGATTFGEYKRHIEKDAALERRFQTIQLNEPTPEEAFTMLRTAKESYEKHHGVIIPDNVLESAVSLSVRYIHDRFLPDKAFDLIDEAGALARRFADQHHDHVLPVLHLMEAKYTKLGQEKKVLIEREAYEEAGRIEKRLKKLAQDIETNQRQLEPTPDAPDRPHLTTTHLLTVLAHWIHVPLERLSSEAPEQRFADIDRSLTTYCIGQSAAQETVLHTLKRSLLHLNDPKRPLGSFLFLGPTGVGKTHFAKMLAEHFFGDPRSLIRLDMSEFTERHSAAQMLGAPAGYVGYGDGGKLTETVRRRPYAVVLFDEIEKAHPDVMNLLLQILDEGQLTDAEGRTVSFKHTIVILTSNIGTESFTQAARIGFTEGKRSAATLPASFAEITEQVLATLKEEVRPELLSRLDHTIVFQPLDLPALTEIARLELHLLKDRLQERGVKFECTPQVASTLAERTVADSTGARHLKKHIAQDIEPLIADQLMTAPQTTKLRLTVHHGTFALHS